MKSKKNVLNLVDMDVGLFVSYQLNAESLSTKLFRIFTLNTIPLKRIMDLREADDEDVTSLNRLNWFTFLRFRRRLCPVYTLQTSENSPRIFMRLRDGSHVALKSAISRRSHE